MVNKSKIRELNLGVRKVSNMNFSKVVTLPKIFTENCLSETMQVQMTMVNGRLTLTPTNSKKGEKK